MGRSLCKSFLGYLASGLPLSRIGRSSRFSRGLSAIGFSFHASPVSQRNQMFGKDARNLALHTCLPSVTRMRAERRQHDRLFSSRLLQEILRSFNHFHKFLRVRAINRITFLNSLCVDVTYRSQQGESSEEPVAEVRSRIEGSHQFRKKSLASL